MVTPLPDMLHAALDAYDNGLCVIRASTDGHKRPLGQWQQWQHQRPTRPQIVEWFTDGHPGMGAVCGAISGDLEMFELEGRFMADAGAKKFTEAMRAAGLELLLKRFTSSYYTISPSDGRHFLYHCTGPVDGNTKLARNASGEVIIETRGEGGFVVLPPSHGTVHPSGRAWQNKGSYSAIPTITSDERAALFDVARSFDRTPPAQPPQPVAPGQRARLDPFTGPIGESWFDNVVQHLNQTWTMQALLEHYGWVYCYTDRHGRVLMRRPGKDEGVSASINARGRLHPFSTSTPFQTGGNPPSTYDVLDVIATYEHSGDRKHAARRIAEQTGIISSPIVVNPPANIDPDTGEILRNDPLGDRFWGARPVLAHIRIAARSRLVAPTALLGAVLARVAAFTPPSACLPAVIGSNQPLNLFVAFRGRSGAGKSSPAAAAADLLPDIPPGCVGPLALGSGEGLVEAYMEMVEETDGGGNKKRVKKQVKRGALFMLDEGQMLAEIASRKGSTVLPVLRTAWSGGDPGQANASIETRRHLRAGSYALGLISLWQDKAAALLLADSDGGTPQRFIWLPTDDPEASTSRPGWPGPLAWTPLPAVEFGGAFALHPDIEAEIVEARVAELQGTTEPDPLDAHRRLNKLKLAGVLAALEPRRNITLEDWDLAEMVMALSDSVRDWVLAEARRRQEEQLEADAKRTARRESIIEGSHLARALESGAKAAYRAVHKANGSIVVKGDIHHAIRSDVRKRIGGAEGAIAEAERLGWITPDPQVGWRTGKAKPA